MPSLRKITYGVHSCNNYLQGLVQDSVGKDRRRRSFSRSSSPKVSYLQGRAEIVDAGVGQREPGQVAQRGEGRQLALEAGAPLQA